MRPFRPNLEETLGTKKALTHAGFDVLSVTASEILHPWASSQVDSTDTRMQFLSRLQYKFAAVQAPRYMY